MSALTKRSASLRAMLAATLEEGATTPSAVTATGAGLPPQAEAVVAPSDPPSSAPPVLPSQESGLPTPAALASQDRVEPSAEEEEEAPATGTPLAPIREVPAVAPPPANGARRVAWEKLSITLERDDLAVLERFHESARAAGVRMRKGGNPSLFIRAALRLLSEVGEEDPDQWARRVAAVIRERAG